MSGFLLCSMAIEKNSFKVMRMDSELSLRSKGSMSSDDDEFTKAVESDEDDDDEFDDCDSGAGSDDFDLLELGETGEEFVQVGEQTCSIPFELYDLSGFGDILSMDVWNDCLTEEERFSLTKYLPDMDQDMFMRTLKELFTGCNIHFGSPITKLFDMFKGGLCEPRVALYRQGMSFFQNCKHYHLLQKRQNTMVANFHQIKDAWANCRGYSIEEKLRVLNIMKSEKSLMHENMEELETDSSERGDSVDGLWTKRVKDQKIGQKTAPNPAQRMSPTLDSSRGRQMLLEPAAYGKHNLKGNLKLSRPKKSTTSEVTGHFPADNLGMEMSPYNSVLAPPRQNKASGYDSGLSVRMRDQIRGNDDAEEGMYEVAVQGPRSGPMDTSGTFKMAKKYEGSRGNEHANSFIGLPSSLKNDFPAFNRNRAVNQLSDIKMLTTKPSNVRLPYEYGKKLKYPDIMRPVNVEEQIKYGNARPPKVSMQGQGSQVGLPDGADQFWQGKVQGEPFPVDQSNYSDRNFESKKWKLGGNSPDIRADRLYQSGYREKPSQEERVMSVHKKQRDLSTMKGPAMFMKGEETDSDSSVQSEEEEDDNPLMRSKLAYPSGVSGLKSSFTKKASLVNKNRKSGGLFDGSSQSVKKIGDHGEHFHMEEGDLYTLKSKQRGKMHDINLSNNYPAKGPEHSMFLGPSSVDVTVNDEHHWREQYRSLKNDQLQNERFSMSSLMSYPAGRRQNADTMRDYPLAAYLPDYGDVKDESYKVRKLARDNGVTGKMRKKGHHSEAYENDHYEADLQLSENSLTRKGKVNYELSYMNEPDDINYVNQHIDDTTPSRKRGKRKLEDDMGTYEKGASELAVIEVAAEDVDLEKKAQKKPYIPITPSVHTGFSFSVVHLLSAVRMAMITLLPVDMVKHQDRSEVGQDEKPAALMDIDNSEQSGKVNVPSLTVQEIVNRVRSNPGDPCILETQEPLQDLVRGVLKIFSSKTAPLGAKGWKTLVLYEKITKGWSWIGPVAKGVSDHEVVEEVTSPEAWGIPHKMLVKLVDSFANWLKSSQETLQQIGSLPPPPLTLMQLNLDDKERFRDLRAQKSLNTISLSSDEVRNYFRKEEALRYSIPDRAFSYTAIDGKKSIVAPLRRCGGKPTSKARDHFMLKRDRPPHVTILCLVRDAAARLPGSIGTRADVCTLIRDSQYIVEDVSDAQVNQVVSGALDRLHYERDPCVQFDGERKLWVYLHREREEEDFEDDGTSSTKKWKRQKKEATESSEQGTVTVAFHGNEDEDQNRFDLSSDLNLDPSCMDDDKRVDLLYYDDRNNMEDNVGGLRSEPGAMLPGPPPVVWETFALNPVQQNRLLGQENLATEVFDGETFGKEQPDDVLGTGLS